MIDDQADRLIRRKINLLQGYMDNLAKYVALEDDILIHNDDKLFASERCFQLVVDEAVDINAILAYKLGDKIVDESKSPMITINCQKSKLLNQ